MTAVHPPAWATHLAAVVAGAIAIPCPPAVRALWGSAAIALRLRAPLKGATVSDLTTDLPALGADAASLFFDELKAAFSITDDAARKAAMIQVVHAHFPAIAKDAHLSPLTEAIIEHVALNDALLGKAYDGVEGDIRKLATYLLGKLPGWAGQALVPLAIEAPPSPAELAAAGAPPADPGAAPAVDPTV